MHHIGQNVPGQNREMRRAQRRRRLHVVHLSQLQRFGPQVAAQSRPAGHAQYQAQEQQPQIGAFHGAADLFRVPVEVYLEYQYGGGNQEHAGDGVQRRIHILDDVVYPASEVSGHDSEYDCEGQHDQRRQGADDQPRSHALERLIENVLADLVGTEHVVIEAERQDGANQNQARSQGHQHRTPSNRRARSQDLRRGVGESQPLSARPQRHERARQREPQHQPADGALGDRRKYVGVAIALRIFQVPSCVSESRVEALHPAVGRLDGLLHEQVGREGRGVGFLLRAAQMHHQPIEYAQHFGRVSRVFARLGGGQTRAIVDGIQQPDSDIESQHDQRGHGDAASPHLAPGRAQMFPSTRIQSEGHDRAEQHKDQNIGPQKYRHGAVLLSRSDARADRRTCMKYP